MELDVGELPGHRETDPEENWLARLLDSRRRQERLRLGHLQIDPAAVHAALAFYRENPSARNELGTEVATGRIRRCDFELEWTEA